jgi:outer membrane immunogenic protein
MKSVLLASVALLALAAAGPVAAADMAVRAPVYKAAPAVMASYNWTGWYVGLNAGGAWSSSEVITQTEFTGGYFAATSVTSINSNGRGNIDSDGFTGGVQSGYNWQAGNIVAGVELDFNYFGTKASRSVTVPYPCCPGTYTINQEVKTDWLFTARPRLGVANNNWLLYLTGGLGVTNLKYNNSFSDTSIFPVFENGSVSKTKAGWTVGGGVEYAVLNAWSVKAEYLYVDFGSVSSTANLIDTGGETDPFSHRADLKSHIVRGGINYKFDWGKGPLVARY